MLPGDLLFPLIWPIILLPCVPLLGHAEILPEGERREEQRFTMAKIIFRNQEWEVSGGKTVREIVEELGLDLESILATRDGTLIHEETVVEDDDTIRLLAVISGGR